jgi:hypothetical protein
MRYGNEWNAEAIVAMADEEITRAEYIRAMAVFKRLAATRKQGPPGAPQ